jgi:hypothetical protein
MNLDSFFAMIVDVEINNKVRMVFASLLVSQSVWEREADVWTVFGTMSTWWLPGHG